MPGSVVQRTTSRDEISLVDDHSLVAPEPTVLATWTATLVRALSAAGLDADALVREAGIDPAVFEQDDARIPLANTTALWDIAVEATGNRALGIDVARYVRPGTFPALGVAVISSATFRDALDRVVRFAPMVMSPPAQLSSAEHGGAFVVTLLCPDDQPQCAYESIEAIMACLVRTARFLTDRSTSPIAVDIARPESLRPPGDRFETFFGCPIRYGCRDYRLVFDADVVNRPLPTGCGDVARTADEVVASYLERMRSRGGVTNEARQAIAALLVSGEPSSSAVAALLAMSGRTMQRRLNEEGVTFRELVTDVRVGLAKQMIRTGRVSMDHVADRLGFGDTAAFRRSFKRHTGLTPGEYATQSSAPD
jgi:AraC-like DNA-binding protein